MADELQRQQDVIGEEYASSLADLTVNSKPLINMLTMLAEENVDAAPVIVKVIEKHLSQVKPEMKLPVLYLVDSIVKNIGGAYTTLFTQNIVSTFCSVFEKVEESTRASMFKLRQTWADVFPPIKLYALDVRVKSIDPAWPITAPPPTSTSGSIHLNPAFLPKERVGYKPNPTKKSGSSQPGKVMKPVVKPAPVVVEAPTPAPVSDLCETEMRESLLKKQKELLELQQKKLEIELLQTKARLQQQQIQMIQTVQQAPDVVQVNLQSAEDKTKLKLEAVQPSVPAPAVATAPFFVPEPMDLSETPPEMDNFDEIVPPQPPTIGSLAGLNLNNRSPDKKNKDKRDKDNKEPNRKKSRKDSDKEDGRIKSNKDSSRSRKGKEQQQQQLSAVVAEGEPAKATGDDDVVVLTSRLAPPRNNTLREAAKAMPRIPKISQRPPPSSLPNRDPRMLKQVQGSGHNLLSGGGGGRISNALAPEDDVQVLADYRSPGRNNSSRSRTNNNHNKRPPSPGIQAERRKMDMTKKDGAVDSKKRRTNRCFDDLFGVEDVDLRKAAPVVPAPAPPPGVVITPPIAPVRDSPPRAVWPQSKRSGPPPPSRGGRGGWSMRGRGGGRRDPRNLDEERDHDGSGSPRNMDFILEQAKENHRNGVISDGEYSTIIRQVFQMTETKMIREVQRRESFPGPQGPGPLHHPDHIPGQDFRYGGRDMPPGRFGPEQDRSWNDPRRGGDRFPPERFPNGPGGPGGMVGGPVGPPGPLGPLGPGAPGRMQRFDMMQPGRGGHPAIDGLRPMGNSPNTAFEVRPDEDMKTIPIDNTPREIRFYGDKAIILMAADDPRLLGFQPCVRRVVFDGVPVDCTVGNEHYIDFHFDGHLHQIKLGAPTRELYIDGKWYECMFGGPPITVNMNGRPVQVVLEGPPPTVKIGTERRFDLLAGRVTMIIDAHSVIPVYLDLKLQHFDMDGQIFTLQFKDALRTVVIDGYPYRVDFGGLPMAIHLDGRKHFVRFSSLPRGVEPGRVLQPLAQGGNVDRPPLVEEEKTSSQTPPLGQLNIGELLSKLVATGLLPGSAPADAPKPPIKEEVKKEEKIRVVNLQDSESMKVRPTGVVSLLYSGMQCGSCGLRFPADQTVRYSTHLDWHFRQNRREKGAAKRPQSRKWYCSVSDWIQFEETETSEEKRLNWFEAQAKEKSEKDGDRNGEDSTPDESTSVAVGSAPEENKCFVCHEELDQFFHEESEEWHLKDAVRMEGITYHRLCYRDHLSNMETGVYVPSDAMDTEEKSASDEEKASSGIDEAASETEGDHKAHIKQEPGEKGEGEQPLVESNNLDDVATAIKTEVLDADAILSFIETEVAQTEIVKMEATDSDLPVGTEEHQVLLTEMLGEAWENNAAQQEISTDAMDADHLDVNNHVDANPEEADVGREETAEAPNVEPEAEKNPVAEQDKFADDVDEATKEFMDVLNSTATPPDADEVTKELMDALIGTGSPANLSPATEEEAQEEEVPVAPPVVVQTPTVISSIDGNVELATQQAAPIASSGIKIKINLFNKVAAASSPASPPAKPAEPALTLPSVVPSTTTDATPESSSVNSEPLLIPPPLDEIALTNKPRLIGRKLTVLPLMTKGTEVSGLCSIM